VTIRAVNGKVFVVEAVTYETALQQGSGGFVQTLADYFARVVTSFPPQAAPVLVALGAFVVIGMRGRLFHGALGYATLENALLVGFVSALFLVAIGLIGLVGVQPWRAANGAVPPWIVLAGFLGCRIEESLSERRRTAFQWALLAASLAVGVFVVVKRTLFVVTW
jgi:hypothetical protein